MQAVKEIFLTADKLVGKLLYLSAKERVCLLDSCGSEYLGSHLLVAGLGENHIIRLSGRDASETLCDLDDFCSAARSCFFTLSYDFGLRLQGLNSRHPTPLDGEPDVFAAAFDCVLIHDYASAVTYLYGDPSECDRMASRLLDAPELPVDHDVRPGSATATSELSRSEYEELVEEIRELIRCGETYQTNLTQKFRVELPAGLEVQTIFSRLRKAHPAAFASFFNRGADQVISISPERFFRIQNLVDRTEPAFTEGGGNYAHIVASPIKGTRARGKSRREDVQMRRELEESEKDRAENTMIVDLLRNDLGRVCSFGSVRVSELCKIEEHPTIFHMVSTIEGEIRSGTGFAEILKALFPCGSVTGCPKINTMSIIDRLEPSLRGLSMGAIGYSFRNDAFPMLTRQFGNGGSEDRRLRSFDLSVAIRTMVVRERVAEFNVGGGVVIDSQPEREYIESLDKARAIFRALGVRDPSPSSGS